MYAGLARGSGGKIMILSGLEGIPDNVSSPCNFGLISSTRIKFSS